MEGKKARVTPSIPRPQQAESWRLCFPTCIGAVEILTRQRVSLHNKDFPPQPGSLLTCVGNGPEALLVICRGWAYGCRAPVNACFLPGELRGNDKTCHYHRWVNLEPIPPCSLDVHQLFQIKVPSDLVFSPGWNYIALAYIVGLIWRIWDFES